VEAELVAILMGVFMQMSMDMLQKQKDHVDILKAMATMLPLMIKLPLSIQYMVIELSWVMAPIALMMGGTIEEEA
jgi:hypothetical protein